MIVLSTEEMGLVAGGGAADDAGGTAATAGAYEVGSTFFGAVAEGAELGSFAGPIGILGGMVVAAGVAALWDYTA